MKSLLAAMLLAGALSAPAWAADEPSAAEQLLFNAPHLAGLKAPRQLLYRYEETEAGKSTLDDEVRMTLQPSAGGGCCKVAGQFLSGAAGMSLPDVDDARANPVLLYFLEFEVRRLARASGGTAAHFRRRIRQAFVDAAVAPTTAQWAGRSVPAKAVTIAPFEDDPYRNRFEDQATVRYQFVLSDDVPGGFLLLTATLPAQDPAQPPRRVDRVSLREGQTLVSAATRRKP